MSDIVKLFTFLRRRTGTTPEQFEARWTEHATHLAATPELRRHVLRFELSPRLAADRDRPRHTLEVDDAARDGVAVLTFADRDRYGAFVREPGLRALDADADHFREPGPDVVVTGAPDVILERPGGRDAAGLKLLCLLRRRPGLAPEAFHDHWRRRHGGLFRDTPELRAPMYAYDQDHGLDLPGARWDGVTEQWFASLEEWTAGLGISARAALVIPDMQAFLDVDDLVAVVSGRPVVVIP